MKLYIHELGLQRNWAALACLCDKDSPVVVAPSTNEDHTTQHGCSCVVEKSRRWGHSSQAGQAHHLKVNRMISRCRKQELWIIINKSFRG
jgi:hypothetical protein